MIDLQIFRFKKLDLHPLTWVPKILLIMKKNYYGFDSYLANYEHSVNRIILSIFLFTWKMIVSQPAHFESSLITIEATLRRITSFSISLLISASSFLSLVLRLTSCAWKHGPQYLLEGKD